MRHLVFDKIEICRCERKDYEPFSSLHYLLGIGHGAICFLLKIDGSTAGFASVLAMPHRGRRNDLLMHRLVIGETFQKYNLSSLILNFLGGIYKSVGKNLYIKTNLARMNRMLNGNRLWEKTNMHQRTRHVTPEDHAKNKARQRRAAYSYKYCSEAIKGYEDLLLPVKEIRKNNLMYKYLPIDVLALVRMKYAVSCPEFFKDFLTEDWNEVKARYEALCAVKTSTSAELYSTEYKIKYRKTEFAGTEYKKRILFLNGLISRLKQKGTTSLETLTFRLMDENEKQGLGLQKYEIIKLALKVYDTYLSRYEELAKKVNNCNSYVVNKEVALQIGLTPKQASNIARKEIRAKQIEAIYRPENTDMENIEIMRDKGLKVSLSTLKRWRKEHGFMKYNKNVIPTIKENRLN